MTLAVSVVVPTSGRSRLLDRCLQGLMEQDFNPAEFEIIVVHDGADLPTRWLVERYAARAAARGTAVRYLCARESKGPAAARNIGWHASTAAIIAFTDDDCIPSRGWLSAGTAVFDDGTAGASGRIVVPIPETPSDYERDAAGLERADFATANCFYQRWALEAAGGFDDRFTAAWREDADLFLTLLEQGAHLTWVSQAVVMHPVRPAPWGISVRQQRKSMFNALLYRKHPRLYRQRIQARPPWAYYVTFAWLSLAAGGTVARRRLVMSIGFTGWILCTSQFCARRLNGTRHTLGHVMEMAYTSAVVPPLAVFWRLYGAVRFRVVFV